MQVVVIIFVKNSHWTLLKGLFLKVMVLYCKMALMICTEHSQSSIISSFTFFSISNFKQLEVHRMYLLMVNIRECLCRETSRYEMNKIMPAKKEKSIGTCEVCTSTLNFDIFSS